MEERGRNDVLLIIGVIVLVIGLGALANTLGLVPPLFWDAMRTLGRAAGPLALVVLGVIVIVVAMRGGVRPTLPGAGVAVYRSRRNRMIAGVAGGLAEYFNVDPLLVRLIFVFIGLASFGSALLLYIILALVMPEAPIGSPVPPGPSASPAPGPSASPAPPAPQPGPAVPAAAPPGPAGPPMSPPAPPEGTGTNA